MGASSSWKQQMRLVQVLCTVGVVSCVTLSYLSLRRFQYFATPGIYFLVHTLTIAGSEKTKTKEERKGLRLK